MTRFGQVTIASLISVFALIGVIAGASSYIGGIKETNAVQDVKIGNVEKEQSNLGGRIDSVGTKVEGLDKKVDALLWQQGINPDKIIKEARK